jgi:hypothetical protein
MKLFTKIIISTSIACIAAYSLPLYAKPLAGNNLQRKKASLLAHNPTMNKKALTLAVRAYEHLREAHKDPQRLLTFINYAKPSFKKRLWVINMNTASVIYNARVAQGKNTGLVYAKHFSNKPRSLESSLGVFLTGNTYFGEHGKSLRLIGLEKQFNSNVYRRAVVMHSAWYVNKSFVKKYGRTGRSWGCDALSTTMAPKVIKTIKKGTVLVSYYPDKKWIQHSAYLQPISA